MNVVAVVMYAVLDGVFCDLIQIDVLEKALSGLRNDRAVDEKGFCF